MPLFDNVCSESFSVQAPACVQEYVATGLTADTDYIVVGITARGKSIPLTEDTSDGAGEISFSVPSGYNNVSSGPLKILFYDADDYNANRALCSPVTLTICSVEYGSITITSFYNNALEQTIHNLFCPCVSPAAEDFDICDTYLHNTVPRCASEYFIEGFTPGDEIIVYGISSRNVRYDLNPTTREVDEDGKIIFTIPVDLTYGYLIIQLYDLDDFETDDALCEYLSLDVCGGTYSQIKLEFTDNVLENDTVQVVCYCDGDVTPPAVPLNLYWAQVPLDGFGTGSGNAPGYGDFAAGGFSGASLATSLQLLIPASGAALDIGDSTMTFWVALPAPPTGWTWNGEPIIFTDNGLTSIKCFTTGAFPFSGGTPSSDWQLLRVSSEAGNHEAQGTSPNYTDAGYPAFWAALAVQIGGVGAVGTIVVDALTVTLTVTNTYLTWADSQSYNGTLPTDNNLFNSIACP